MTPALLQRLQAAREANQPICLLSSKTRGAIALIHVDGQGTHDQTLRAASAKALRTNTLQTIEHGDETFYIAPYNPPVSVYVVGAVHIAQALVPMLEGIDISCCVIDPRSAFANDDRFGGTNVITNWPDEALASVALGPRTAIIALTHDPKLDDPALSVALKSDAFYIGALGSKRTHAKRTERLEAQGFSAKDIARIAAPIGLNIGATSPAEIAISIAAQLVQALRGPKP